MKHDHYIDDLEFQVLKNYKGRYVIWPLKKTVPGGWRIEGKIGTKKECLQYLLDLWKISAPTSWRQMLSKQQLQT